MTFVNKSARMLAACCIASAVSLTAPAAADVQVEFSGSLADYVGQISSIDRNREEVFREFRKEGTVNQLKTKATNGNTEWGNERVIPDLAAYDVPKLIQGMMERGIKAADPEFAGKVVVTVDKLRIKKFPLATISSHSTRMSGHVKVLDAAGNLVAEHDISTLIVPTYTTTSYKGPDYAYLAGALDTRVGPIAAEFTEKALEKMYPGYDAPGAIVVMR